MKYDIKVVHLSATPLVAAPAKLARVLSRNDIHSVSLYEKDYPGKLEGIFTNGTIKWPNFEPSTDKMLTRYLESARVIHIHNQLSDAGLKKLAAIDTDAKFIYQVHSSPKEGPLYIKRGEELAFDFQAKLVVAQQQARQYQDYIAVPNIVDALPSLNLIKDGEKPKLLFSPTHKRGGRWGQKTSEKFEQSLKALAGADIIELVMPQEAMSPDELMQLRRNTHISIDEVFTGGFHQVSLEAMCAGNAVINNADLFSKYTLSSAIGAKKLPPFVEASESTITAAIKELAANPEYLRDIQKQSYNYFKTHLSTNKLAGLFANIYNGALDENISSS